MSKELYEKFSQVFNSIFERLTVIEEMLGIGEHKKAPVINDKRGSS
jgi:hypothetical protein